MPNEKRDAPDTRCVIRIVGPTYVPPDATRDALAEIATLSGRYLRAYDPAGREGRGKIVATDDPARAKVYADVGAALVERTRAWGARPDGRPNRPLTAYNIEVVYLAEALARGRVTPAPADA